MKETERTRNHHLRQHHRGRMMSSSTVSSNEGRDLPEDVLLEIFLYLPADSLVRYRFVCKYWFNLITSNIRNPRFVQMHHYHHPPSNATITTDNLPIILYTPSKQRHSHELYSLNINDEADAIEIVYPFKSRSSKLEILGSCNGLLCILVTDYDGDGKGFTSTRRKIVYPKDIICLWNPSTNEFKQVPTEGGHVLYGFGYDRLINEYKLIRLVWSYYEVYTMGTNSWKMIDKEVPFLGQISRQVMSLYVNGALHWLSSKDNQIYSFNIEDEEFGEVPIPEWLETVVMWEGQLQVLRGCLCISNGYIDQCSKGRFEVWMMMDYGVEESWTKLFRAIDPNLMPWGHLNPLWICKNGEVVIENGTDQYLVIYDPNNKKVESIGYHGNPSKWTNTIVHIGSLVSLKSGTYVGQEQQPGQASKKKKAKTKKRGREEEY